jgi:hypothetical protein
MQASKAFLWAALIFGAAALGFFAIFEDSRPDFVENWFRKARGLTPAKTPTEALEKFRDCIRKRDYKSAVIYCGGEYAEYLRRDAKAAKSLCEAIDDLLHNVEDVAHINSPVGKQVLLQLEPFPKEFAIEDVKTSSDETTASARIRDQSFEALRVEKPEYWTEVDERIIRSLWPGDLPRGLFLMQIDVELKYEGEKEKAWKIHFPVTDVLRAKADYLKQNYGNYTRGLESIKYAIKHEAAAKADFEGQLKSELQKAK